MEKEIICGIYKITSPSSRIYIGQSINIYKRWNWYKGCLQRKNSNSQPQLHRSFKKYGVENHTFEVVVLCSVEELDEKEIFYIEQYKSYNNKYGLNCTLGGDGVRGLVFSKETLNKMSESAKRSTVRYMLGKKLSDEVKKKIGDKHRGRKDTPETIEKKRILMLKWWEEKNKMGGVTYSEERIKQMSEARMGIPASEIQKKGMKKAWKKRKDEGRDHHSEETKRKIKESIKLHWIKRRETGQDKSSPESSAKRSASLKKTWAKRKMKKNK